MVSGAQIWGIEEHDAVERFFVKKLFGLPRRTPKLYAPFGDRFTTTIYLVAEASLQLYSSS